MKSLTEAQLKTLLKKAWAHGFEQGFKDCKYAYPRYTANECLAEPMVQTICNGKLIELVGEA